MHKLGKSNQKKKFIFITAAIFASLYQYVTGYIIW